MGEMQQSQTQETVVPAPFPTPALTHSTLGTPGSLVAAERTDPLLATPGHNQEDADISASFLIPSTSYDVTVC